MVRSTFFFIYFFYFLKVRPIIIVLIVTGLGSASQPRVDRQGFRRVFVSSTRRRVVVILLGRRVLHGGAVYAAEAPVGSDRLSATVRVKNDRVF